MAWQPASSAAAPPLPLRSLTIRYQLKIFLLAGLLLACLLGFFASFALLVLFMPKPELADWTPPGIKCATCEVIVGHNVDLAVRLDCTGKGFKVCDLRDDMGR
jgi:hypothetical protein